MKRIMYAAFAVLAFVYPATAQITLSKNDFNSYLNSTSRNTSYTTLFDDGLSDFAAKVGPNQTFDLSQLIFDGNSAREETVSYFSGNSQHVFNHVPEFANADVVTRMNVTGESTYIYTFYRFSNDGLVAIGVGEYDAAIGLAGEHQIFPVDFLVEKLPQTYGTEWETRMPFEWDMDDDFTDVFRTVSTTVNNEEIVVTMSTSVDGWGTLKLPNGQSFSALRATVVMTTSFMGFEFETKSVVFKTKEGHSADIIFDDEGMPVEASYTVAAWETQTSDPDDRSDLPEGFGLAQNYPNPFNPSTTIGYSLPFAADVTLTVVDLTGRVVSTLEFPRQSVGTHQVQYDASKLSSGVYLYRIDAGGYSASRKFTLVK